MGPSYADSRRHGSGGRSPISSNSTPWSRAGGQRGGGLIGGHHGRRRGARHRDEAEEDLLNIVGVGDTVSMTRRIWTAFRRVRCGLVVTLVNTPDRVDGDLAVRGTIGQYPALAVLMPITAAMGGKCRCPGHYRHGPALATRTSRRPAIYGASSARNCWVGLMNACVFAAILGTLARSGSAMSSSASCWPAP